MTRYEIREICGDWAIYEVRETETEGGERCLLILNSRSNAEYVKAILEHEAKDPNAAVRYFPRAELMSDAEVLAVFRLCAPDEVGACDKCPLKGRDVCREEINRRVLEMAEKYLEHRKNIELIRALIETAAECGAWMKGGAEQRFFSPKDVQRMTRTEVRDNYQAILDSIKKWK